MARYNYYEAVKNDIREYLNDDYEWERIEERDITTADELCEYLNDELWIDDSVTGNGSGSYTFNRYVAKEYVEDNLDLVREMVQAFCIDADTLCEHFLDEDYEWFDVSIRCYVLGECIADVVSEMGF